MLIVWEELHCHLTILVPGTFSTTEYRMQHHYNLSEAYHIAFKQVTHQSNTFFSLFLNLVF